MRKFNFAAVLALLASIAFAQTPTDDAATVTAPVVGPTIDRIRVTGFRVTAPAGIANDPVIFVDLAYYDRNETTGELVLVKNLDQSVYPNLLTLTDGAAGVATDNHATRAWRYSMGPGDAIETTNERARKQTRRLLEYITTNGLLAGATIAP